MSADWFLAGLMGECPQGAVLGLVVLFFINDTESSVYENTFRENQLEGVNWLAFSWFNG